MNATAKENVSLFFFFYYVYACVLAGDKLLAKVGNKMRYDLMEKCKGRLIYCCATSFPRVVASKQALNVSRALL